MSESTEAPKTVADYFLARGWTVGSILETTQNGVVYRKQVVQIGPSGSTVCRLLSVTVDGKPILDSNSDPYQHEPDDLCTWEKVGECRV